MTIRSDFGSHIIAEAIKNKEVMNMTITIEFKISLEENQAVYIDGIVERNDKIGEDVDQYFYDGNQILSSQLFVEHEDIDGLKGATDEQEFEIENFKIKYQENKNMD